MRRFILGACSATAAVLVLTAAAPGCGSDDASSSSSSGGDEGGTCTGFGCTDGGKAKPADCVNLCQDQVDCNTGAGDPAATTSITGTVLDPAGKVPIFNAIVYVPNADVADIPTGASCDRCDAKVSGAPLVITQTDVEGKFTLENMPIPASGKVPLVIQIGKWRRQVIIDAPAKCTSTAIDPTVTRLPRNRMEGNIPRIAIATGAADPLQCLFHKIGLDSSEFGVKGSDARVHMYEGGGISGSTTPTNKLDDQTAFPNAEGLWGSVDALKEYDIVVLGCEGIENDVENTPSNTTHKPASAKQALYDYAKLGGRVFTSHFHYTFFSTANAPADTQSVGTWRPAPESTPPPAFPSNPTTTAVNASFPATPFPKAQAMKDWLTKQNALNGDGTLPIFDARHNLDAVADGKALDWLHVANPNASNANAVQYMSFNAPVGAPDDQICGRVVFSDLHVGQGKDADGSGPDDPTNAATFPAGCVTKDLSAQQKALEFMLFDLSSCVQKDDQGIQIPK